MVITDQFAHVLLFSCPQCGAPLASACASRKRNLEQAEAHWFKPHCHCGWTDELSASPPSGTGSKPGRNLCAANPLLVTANHSTNLRVTGLRP